MILSHHADLTDGIGVVTPNQTPNADKSGLHGEQPLSIYST